MVGRKRIKFHNRTAWRRYRHRRQKSFPRQLLMRITKKDIKGSEICKVGIRQKSKEEKASRGGQKLRGKYGPRKFYSGVSLTIPSENLHRRLRGFLGGKKKKDANSLKSWRPESERWASEGVPDVWWVFRFTKSICWEERGRRTKSIKAPRFSRSGKVPWGLPVVLWGGDLRKKKTFVSTRRSPHYRWTKNVLRRSVNDAGE